MCVVRRGHLADSDLSFFFVNLHWKWNFDKLIKFVIPLKVGIECNQLALAEHHEFFVALLLVKVGI